MTRALLVLLLLSGGIALAAPLAEAQVLGSVLTLSVAPGDEPIVEGGRLILYGTLTFTGDVTAVGNVNGIPVTYVVADAPAWATVVVSPSSDVLPVPFPSGPGLSYTVTRMFTIIVDAGHGGVDGDVGAIEVVASANPSMPASSKPSAKALTPIRYEAAQDDCPEPAVVAAPAPAPEHETATAAPARAETGGTTTVQSSAATPLALPIAAVAGFGAVGAGAGLLLRRRRG